jgi:uracil-DNA glycosylase family 4
MAVRASRVSRSDTARRRRIRFATAPTASFNLSHAVREQSADSLKPTVPSTELDDLHETIDQCRKCESSISGLCKPIRMFRGLPAAVMIVGQGPGKKERSLGFAFAGQSGRRLDEWLWQCRRRGGARDGIYLTSVVKCVKRSEKELEVMVQNCRPYLDQQISLIRPRLIITLGRLAFESLNFSTVSFSDALCIPLQSREHVLFSPFEYHFALLPWPHPSGLNRWLNKPKNREALRRSFQTVATFLDEQ